MDYLEALNRLPPAARKAAIQYRLAKAQSLVYQSPADFIESEMVIPETGKPMELHPEIRYVLNEMSSRDENGNFKYSTWLFSMPKKSGKTAIGAGVALWQANRLADGEIYVIGNDLKQADNRMAQAMRYCIDHNPRMTSRIRVIPSSYKMLLDNGTRIESIPVDPRGEAGMNPTGLFLTEAWGLKGKNAELMWSEATLSPTRLGQSFKFIESYAGHIGESEILYRLYESIVLNGAPHPTIPELYINGASIAYWCTRRYLPWQQDESYYRQQALEKTPEEFDRQHNNKWASASAAFVPMEWWNACKGTMPDLRPGQGIILGLDAAVHDDCFAIVGVSRDGDNIQVRYARVWYPPPNGVIPFEEVETELRRLFNTYRIECVAYDEYQAADLSQRLDKLAWWYRFPQGKDRAIADKQLYDLIRERRIIHNGESDLTEHIGNANRKPEDDKLRIIKRTQQKKVDASVSLSMACYQALRLNI